MFLGDLSMFDVLNPKQLPVDSAVCYTYSPKIMPLARRFGFDTEKVTGDFSEFLEHLIEDHPTEYCMHRSNDDPISFWSHFLKNEGILWPAQLRQLVLTVLSLPVGSVDAERGFSILTHTRYDRRSRLTPQHMDDILFLRINGPPVEKFDPAKYVKHWLQSHRESDDPLQQRQQNPKSSSDIIMRSNLF